MSNNDINLDKVLIFDLKGPTAHFRKYYTNSSSLSYLFPPRTVISGLIAGLLGIPNEKEKDEKKRYYEQFSDENCFISVSLRTKIRKIMQTVNYIRTKRLSELNGSAGGTQIPLEILLPEEAKELVYRIYFWYKNKNNIYSQLKQRLENQSFVYPPYMGLTEFLASIEYVGEGKLTPNLNEKVVLNVPCRVKDVDISFDDNKNQWYVPERMPSGFLNDRTPTPHCDYLIIPKDSKLTVKIKSGSACYSVEYLENGCTQIENIIRL